jgi:unsaturated chondroitin disaccharide hydrolase
MFRTAPPGNRHPDDPTGNFMVIIDQAMDMEPLWWMWKETGDTSYRDMATSHLLKLASNFVRADGSTMQLGYYNSSTGAFVAGDVKQGAGVDSTWSRGQAWAIHGYTTAYVQTKNPAFLDIARKVANYWIANVPADGVPFWDFSASTIKDSSAAAIAASGFAELARVAPDLADQATYKAAAQRTIASLVSPGYLSEGKASPGILLHQAHWVLKNAYPDNTIVYGDFYVLQAMNRYLALA